MYYLRAFRNADLSRFRDELAIDKVDFLYIQQRKYFEIVSDIGRPLIHPDNPVYVNLR